MSGQTARRSAQQLVDLFADISPITKARAEGSGSDSILVMNWVEADALFRELRILRERAGANDAGHKARTGS